MEAAAGKEGEEEQELLQELVPCYTEAVKWLCRLGGTFVCVCPCCLSVRLL